MTTKHKDDDVPPLGYCAGCIREGIWTTALATYQGTSTCAHHLLYDAGTGELDWPDNVTDSQKLTQILDRLARNNPTGSAQF
jgi:hypothetical protein